jgi:hypothetical protein
MLTGGFIFGFLRHSTRALSQPLCAHRLLRPTNCIRDFEPASLPLVDPCPALCQFRVNGLFVVKSRTRPEQGSEYPARLLVKVHGGTVVSHL